MRFTLPFVILVLITFNSCKNNKADYKYIGAFNYEIFNDSLYSNSYLSESFGYVIGDLNLKSIGVTIFNIDTLNPTSEYIITINHPIKSVFTDSDNIKGEAQDHLKKKPLDITLNKDIKKDSIYIYSLKPKGKYRYLLP